MRIEMTIKTDAVTTTVSRDYEPHVLKNFADEPVSIAPSLSDVTQAVAVAAVAVHHLTSKE